jgi:hypothetical protein
VTVSRAEQAVIAERRARVLQLRVEQVPYAQIATLLGISEGLAEKDFQRALEARKTELDARRHVAVALEVAKLDALERVAWGVLRTRHILAQQGKIVCTDDGTPLEDDGPTLAAIDRILKIAERRARMLGHDAPVRAKVEVTDAIDADIERLVAELAGLAPGSETEAAGTPGGGGEQAPPA